MPKPAEPDATARSTAIARALRSELARRRMTQEGLAKLTGLSLATIGRTLRGQFRPGTIDLIESRLEVDLRGRETRAAQVAAPVYGSYHYDAVAHLIGDYLCARRAFSRPDALALYPIAIRWSHEPAGLAFEESNKLARIDYSQAGFVHIPPGCSYLHLATVDRGSVRLITVSFVADKLIDSEPMRGLILTLYNPVASSHVPAVSAFVMMKLGADDPRRDLSGLVEAADPRCAAILAEIETAERHQALSTLRSIRE